MNARRTLLNALPAVMAVLLAGFLKLAKQLYAAEETDACRREFKTYCKPRRTSARALSAGRYCWRHS